MTGKTVKKRSGPVLLQGKAGKNAEKGAWRMPRLSEAMKDVISCDKLRLGANNL